MISATVAVAVARAAAEDGVADELVDPIQQVYDAMWLPDYPELIIETVT
jgi:malate dehydrogenase (oxaloacetate-decarboxylating)